MPIETKIYRGLTDEMFKTVKEESLNESEHWKRMKRPDFLLKINEAAIVSNMSVKQIRQRIDLGLIVNHKLDGTIRIFRSDLDHYLKQRRLEAIL